MKKLLLVFFCPLIFNTNAQVVFCPPGAEWHYTFTGWGPEVINETIKYTHDSVVNSLSVKVLKHSYFFSHYTENVGLTLIKQSGDTVFMRNNRTQNNWQILYNYAALPGQSWTNSLVVGSPSNTVIATSTVRVDSINYPTINGLPLKKMSVKYYSSYNNNSIPSNAKITERFGCNVFLFNYINLTYSDGLKVQDFLCYKDNQFGLKQFGEKTCDYSNLTGLKENSNENEIIIAPNPAQEYFIIKTNTKGNAELTLTDISGKEVKKLTIKGADKINISDLNTGIYFLSFSENGVRMYTSKLIKE